MKRTHRVRTPSAHCFLNMSYLQLKLPFKYRYLLPAFSSFELMSS